MSSAAHRRVRLAPDARRRQLLDAGVRLLGEAAPEQLSVADVSREAGISRGLLYHYFENWDDFIAAVLQRASEQLREALTPDASLPPRQRVHAGVAAFIDHAERHAAGFRAVFAPTAAPRLVAIVDAARERDLEAFVAGVSELSAAPAAARRSNVLRAALHAHMHLMAGATLRWLEHGDITREQLQRLMLAALDGVLAGVDAIEPGLRLSRRGEAGISSVPAG